MFNHRIVIPQSLRRAVLQQFHLGHPGTDRMKSIARSHVYWPGLDTDIENYVKQCSRCQQAAKHPPKQQPVPWPETDKPWSRVHIDYAGPTNGLMYLVLVDAYSKWPEVIPMTSTSATQTVSALRRLFSQHGLPETIVSDNGTQFVSATFSEFCEANNIDHIRTPPYHPQSNGQAERFVDTFKRALVKAKGEVTTEEALQRFLLVYRSTPNKTQREGKSPAEALMGRKLRTINSALQPTEHTSTETGQPPVGSMVYARNYRPGQRPWTSGTISGYRGKMLLEIQTDRGQIVRHRNQIRPRHHDEEATLTNSLPLELLLDTFELPANRSFEKPARQQRTYDLTPRRWSYRRCRQTPRMQVDPRKKQY